MNHYRRLTHHVYSLLRYHTITSSTWRLKASILQKRTTTKPLITTQPIKTHNTRTVQHTINITIDKYLSSKENHYSTPSSPRKTFGKHGKNQTTSNPTLSPALLPCLQPKIVKHCYSTLPHFPFGWCTAQKNTFKKQKTLENPSQHNQKAPKNIQKPSKTHLKRQTNYIPKNKTIQNPFFKTNYIPKNTSPLLQLVFNNLGGLGPGHLDEPHELRFDDVADEGKSEAVDVVTWNGLKCWKGVLCLFYC